MDDGGLIIKNNDLIKNRLGADSPESSKKKKINYWTIIRCISEHLALFLWDRIQLLRETKEVLGIKIHAINETVLSYVLKVSGLLLHPQD